GFPVGLVRVDLSGEYEYISQDPWYGQARFINLDAVSPDGREVLINHGGGGCLITGCYADLYLPGELPAVDVVPGQRRVVVPTFQGSFGLQGVAMASWSPDGQHIAVRETFFTGHEVGPADSFVVSRDGSRAGELLGDQVVVGLEAVPNIVW